MPKKSKTSPNPNLSKLAGVCLALWAAAGAGTVRAYDLKDDNEVSSKKPVLIDAYQLSFDRLRGLTLFSGDVNAHHAGTVILADQIRALEENREATAEGHVKVTDKDKGITLTCGNLEYQDMMELMTAHDHPLLTMSDEKGHPVSVLGRQMEVDSVHKTVVVNQNVQIQHKEGRAEAQKATFLSRQDQFILEGKPKVYTDNGLLSGRRILSNLAGDRSVIVEGMADGYFNPNGKPVVNSSQSATPGVGGGPGSPKGNGPVTNGTDLSHNATTPLGMGTDSNPMPTPTSMFHWQ